MATLKILSGSLTGQDVDLDLEPTFIGRASSNQVKIVDPGVSSKHAKIWAENGRWFIMDLGSTNGTLVNNADIDREELSDGDKVAFGPVMAKFVAGSGRARVPSAPPAPPPRAARPVSSPAVAAMPVGMPGGRESELELELSTLKARYATLEKEIDKQRQEAYEREKIIADQAVSGMRAEMEKLRELMRERDESMRTVEAQSKERESWFSPEEVERERKRVEAGVQLETRRQIEAYERQVRDLDAKVSGRAAELEALQRSMREKDELVRMLSEREDRAGEELKEKDDRISQFDEELRRIKEDLVASQGRERELDEKLKQKNLQLAELGKAQADFQQELSRARAMAARSAGGDAGAAATELANELDQQRTQLLKAKAELSQVQDELITARSARDQEAAKAQALQRQLDDVQGEVTDLADDKAKLEGQVEELVRKHSEAAEAERKIAGIQAELDSLRSRDETASGRIRELEAKVAELESARLDLIAERDAALTRLNEVEADYKVLRGSRDESYDWEARYKSQVEDLETLRRKNSELQQTVEALEAGASTHSGTVDDSQLTYLRSRTTVLEAMAAGMLEGVNNAVSLMRRNSEVLKGYVHDCGLLANCVRQIDYTRLEPEQQQMLRELIDETQPDVIIRNMESIGEENADATTRAKKLILDWQEAMKVDEEGTDLERCFAKSQGLFQSMEPGADIRVKVGGALPPLPAGQSEGVMFAFAVLREAKRLSVDEDQMPTVRIDAEGDTVTMMISPVHPKAKERYRETLGGGGDPSSQFVLGFAREACKGRIDVKDMGDASTMFVTLNRS